MDNIVKVSFQNRFTRRYKPLQLALGLSGHVRDPHLIFKDGKQYIDQAFNAETTRFSDAKARNIRTTYGTLPELAFSTRKTGSYIQAPVMSLSIDIAYVVFGNHELRNKFNQRFNPGTQIPKCINDIYLHVRETQNNQVRIGYGDPIHDDSLAFLKLEGTILDVNELLTNDSVCDLAFSMLIGNGWCETYNLPFDTFNQVPSVTQMSTVSSIDVSINDGVITLSVFPFSNIKQTNFMYDPTFKEALHNLFGGMRIYTSMGNQLKNNLVTSVFDLNLNAYDYAFYKIDFFCSLPVAFLNPGMDIEKSKTRINNVRKEFKKDGFVKETVPNKVENAMTAFSGEKVKPDILRKYAVKDMSFFDNILQFANNLFKTNPNYFAGFVRINKLYNLLYLIK